MNLDRNLIFKGNREYLHSTTVFDDILQLRQADIRDIDFRFNIKTDRQVRYQSEAPEEGIVPIALWRDSEGLIFVIARDEKITGRHPYDEDGLAKKFFFRQGYVAIPEQLGKYSVIEALVAGFKAMLQRSLADATSRLAFVRLRLGSIPVLPLHITYRRKIGEFYHGDIHSESDVIGQIFFGEWK